MIEEVERLDRVVEELLDFARPVRPDKRPTDVNAVVRESVALVSEDAAFKKVSVQTRLGEGLPTVLVDPASDQAGAPEPRPERHRRRGKRRDGDRRDGPLGRAGRRPARRHRRARQRCRAGPGRDPEDLRALLHDEAERNGLRADYRLPHPRAERGARERREREGAREHVLRAASHRRGRGPSRGRLGMTTRAEGPRLRHPRRGRPAERP